MNLTPPAVSLRQLQYAVAVADRKSFRQAAEACRVAQPSLSAQVAQLERALGVRLFERDRRRVLVTEAGAELIGRARALLVASEDLVELARGLSDPHGGTLRLGVIPTIGPYLLPTAAAALRAEHPRRQFVWHEDRTAALLGRLSAGELDGAVVALVEAAEGLSRVVLGEDEFVLAMAPGHALAAARRPVRLEQLEGERVMLLDDEHCLRDQALAYCSRVGVEEAGYRATSLATLVQMVAGGAGVTLLPRLSLALENRLGTLRVRSFTAPRPRRTLALVWRPRSAMGKALRAVGETLRQSYTRACDGAEGVHLTGG